MVWKQLIRKTALDVDRPTFIIGCPRSGTTIFAELVSSHPFFAWPSQYVNRFSKMLGLAALSRVYDMPFVGEWLWRHPGMRFVPHPVEAWHLFRSLDEAFYPMPRSSPEVQAELGQASAEVSARFRRAVCLLQRYQHKHRFVAKYTNKPRVRYLSSIFPDAKFLHILRDGRAVVHSLRQKALQEGWMLPDERMRWMDVFPSEWKETILKSDDPLVAFLACYSCHIVERIERQLAEISPDRRMTIRYEQFVTEPIPTFRRVCAFVDVPWSPRFGRLVRAKRLTNRDYKWKHGLSNQQIDILDQILDSWERQRTVEQGQKREVL